jgi:hypothetical protein
VFRGLYNDIHNWNEQGPSLHWSVLAPWIDSHPSEVLWLTEFANRGGDPIPPASFDDLHNLYSLQRVNDILMANNFQGEYFGMDRRSFRVSMAEYVEFFVALGMRVVDAPEFSPVVHEIFEVLVDPNDDCPIGVLEQKWPLLMLGNMVFSRAGVVVLGGANHIAKDAAEGSTMYWAFCRNNRPTMDLSVGWGSNSQWRTSFRRDYLIDNYAYLNVDGKEIAERIDDLPEERALELLSHRCLIRSTLDADHEFWPYHDRATIAQ